MSKKIGTRIYVLRKAHNLTLEELAEMLEITPRFLKSVALGSRSMRASRLEKLSNIFRISPNFLGDGYLILNAGFN